jgi:hypothetical protein
MPPDAGGQAGIFLLTRLTRFNGAQITVMQVWDSADDGLRRSGGVAEHQNLIRHISGQTAPDMNLERLQERSGRVEKGW